MTDKVIFVSVNLRGVQLAEKRKDVLNFLKQRKYSIYFLQDTHFTKREENYIRSQWGFECFFSSFSSESRGCAIMFNNNVEYKLHSKEADLQGNKLVLDITINGKRMTLINIYGPNRDTPEFFSGIKTDIQKSENPVILAGDFNLVLDPSIDLLNYKNVNNPQARNKVIEIIAECGLIDCWRKLNAEKQSFTWTQPNSNKRARLDYFLISEDFFSDIDEVNILPGYRTDHSMILLSFKFNKFSRGHSYWKFNNSLLKDSTYVTEIKNVINRVKEQYALPVENILANEIPPKDLIFTINDQLFFEVLLMEIRGKTISYSSFLKKQANKEEEKLLKDIQQLQSEATIDHDLLRAKNQALEEFRNKKMEGVKLRSKAKWVDEGEKVTQYFCNLENRNFISKCMPTLISNNGELLNQQDSILQETKNFYQHLYTEKAVENINLKSLLGNMNVPVLNNEKRDALEGQITYDELLSALKRAKNNKSPGSDGFTVEFFKFFWIDIGFFLLRSLNYGFSNKELSVTQKEGIITCIPKSNKDRQYLKNWRPISLLNCSYKLASACLANRLKKVLPDLISKDQTGFMAGRYIGENIRIVYDLLHYTEIENIPGILLLIDFEKAFDSVSWKFIDKVLDFFNFGSSFKSWINTFNTNTNSCVHINGHLSERFFLQRGCRQGDPISPYIFLLCVEILAILIKNNKNIKGIKVGDKEFVMSQYADDTSLILDGSENSLKHSLLTLKFYAKLSGLGVNVDKTSVIWIGSMRNSNRILCKDYNLNWVTDKFSLLGVTLSTNLQDIVPMNFEEKLPMLRDILNSWSKRILTPLGKLVVIKTLVIPKLNHLFIGLPNPSEEFIKTLQNMCFNFLWKNGPDRIKRVVAMQGYESGGLRMTDISHFISALKISWIRRSIIENKDCFIIHNVMYPFYDKCLIYGSDYIKTNLERISNPFWFDTYKALYNLALTYKPFYWKDFLCSPLWYNHNIKVGRKSCFIRNWFQSGVVSVNDIMDRNGNFYTLEAFRDKYFIDTNFLTYHGIIAACESYLQSLNFQHLPSHEQQPLRPILIQVITKDKKGCRSIYDIFINKNIQPTSVAKWEREFVFDRAPEWTKYFSLPFKTTKDSSIIWFQLRLLHRILPTNYLLTKMNIKDNNKCTFCKTETETLKHLFWECRCIQVFWTDYHNFLTSKNIIIPRDWNDQTILFGSLTKDRIFNLMLLKAKQFIYVRKLDDSSPVLNSFISIMKSYYHLEKYNAVKNGNMARFNKDWDAYKILFLS